MQDQVETKPSISVIVICYDMRREIVRTMQSLAPEYQKFKGVYDVDLVEMPSERMLTSDQLDRFSENTRYFAESENFPLPVAVNRAVARARADHVLICVDGARILSPGVLRACKQSMKQNKQGVLAVHGLHLGAQPQQVSVANGTHSTKIEDALLADINFPDQPHGLWRISCWAGSSRSGVFGGMAESCAIFLSRDHFQELGGYDERIVTPGGGLANCDFYTRATSDPKRPLFVPLGEGTFHQMHGGATTGRALGAFEELKIEFTKQTGHEFRFAELRPTQYLGAPSPAMRPLLRQSLESVMTQSRGKQPVGSAKMVSVAMAKGFRTPTRPTPAREITLVVGMHRSGTSFFTRQLLANGYAMPGKPLGGSSRSNEDGHFEPQEVIGFGNRVLMEQGLSWHSLSPPAWDNPSSGKIARYGGALRHLLLDIKGRDSVPWAIKDPRVCLMLPIWDKAFDLLNWRSKMLFVMRDPMLVAKSLKKRNGMAIGHGVLLWARYVSSLLNRVENADDVVCIDRIEADGLAEWLARKTVRDGFKIEPVKPAEWPETNDPISAAYRRFTSDRDLDALRTSLKAELAFVDLYADYFQSADQNMGNAF